MASSLPFIRVTLNENDVPGAKLIYHDVERNSTKVLKRFLDCRQIKSTGNKITLIKRVQEAINNNTPICQGVDNGAWPSNKEQERRRRILVDINADNVDAPPTKKRQSSVKSSNNKLTAPPLPPVFPIVWKPFPTTDIPQKFCYGHIFYYLITSCVTYKLNSGSDDGTSDDDNIENDYGCSKPFERGRLYFKSGHVSKMEDNAINNYYCLKASVRASYKNRHYKVMVMLQNTGCVADASCECKVSSMGRCSHVAALLLALEDYLVKNKTACTSQRCEWNQGRKEKDPGVVRKQYSSVIDPGVKFRFDPRSVVLTEEEDEDKKNAFFLEMQKAGSYWQLLLQPPYEDYEIDDIQKTALLWNVAEFKSNMMFRATSPKQITTGQCSDPMWMQYRKYLITASSIKDYHLNKTPEQLFNITNRHLYSNSKVNCSALEYGRRNEEFARQQYVDCVKKRNDKVEVLDSGLWINPEYPGIGASPDGLVMDPDETPTHGVLEIKCPQLLQSVTPWDLQILDKQQLKRFCSELKNGSMELKRAHKYFRQIQVQMGITGRDWCDFVIWMPKAIDIQRIRFEERYFKSSIVDPLQYYNNVLVPEYFEQRVPRRLTPLVLN